MSVDFVLLQKHTLPLRSSDALQMALSPIQNNVDQIYQLIVESAAQSRVRRRLYPVRVRHRLLGNYI